MINDFLIWMQSEGKSKSTIKVYINALQKLMVWFENTEGNPFVPREITTLHIHEFQNYMDKIEKLEPTTINKILASLKTYFKYCLEEKLVAYNPMIKVKMKRAMTQYAAPRWINKQELARFYHAVEQTKNEKRKALNMAICHLMSGAGLRVQEVSDLAVTDIYLEKKRENVIVRNGKGDKYRIVPLNNDVIESIQEWLKYRASHSNEYLFITEHSTPILVRSIHYMVSRYALKAALSDVSPHTLRHTFCKSLIDQDVGIEQVAYLAGHDSLETTKRYIQPSENDLRKAVQTISEKR